MHPTISIIIPTCNKAHLLERALVRYERQRFPLKELELIVIDDWSQDWTDRLLRHWANRLNIITIRPSYRDPNTERSDRELVHLGYAVSHAVGITFESKPEIMVGDETLQDLLNYHNTEIDDRNIFYLSADDQLHLDEVNWEEDLLSVGKLGCIVFNDPGMCLYQNTERETIENPYYRISMN